MSQQQQQQITILPEPPLLYQINMDELLQTLKNDPSTIANIDFTQIYALCENNNIIGTKTNKQILEEKYTVLSHITQNIAEKRTLYTSLNEYIFIDEIHKIKTGAFIRYIKMPCQQTIPPQPTPKLNKGGIVVNIIFRSPKKNGKDNSTGCYILIRCTYNQKFIQIKYDDYLIFQKMETDELIILMANDHLAKHLI